MPGLIDVQRSPELQATIIACKRVDADLRKAIFAASREAINPLWLPGLNRRATTKGQQMVIVKGARAAIRVDGFSLFAATSKKKLRGGLQPSTQWQAFEFGANTRVKKDVQTKSRLGKAYTVSKRINVQFPDRVKNGKVAFDTASEVGTKAVAAWVVAVVTTIVQATEGEAS
jgi:hypothetical protein